MKIQKKVINFFLLFSFVSFAFGASVGTLNVIPDAQTASVAGSYNYLTKNIWNVYYNQAGLAKQTDIVTSLSYKRIMNVFNYANVVAGMPLAAGYAAFGASFLDYGMNVMVTTIDSSTGLPVSGNKFYAYDFLVSLAYAYVFKPLELSFGMGIKFLQNEIDNSRVFYGIVDFSAMKNFLGDLSLGLNVRNLGLGLNSTDTLPLKTSLGFALPSTFFYKSGDYSTRFIILGQVNFDVLKTSVNNIYGTAGIKYIIKNIFNINAGVALGQNDYFIRFSSIGVGYNPYNKLSINYSFNQEADDIGFNHTLTLTYYPFIKEHSYASKQHSIKKQSVNKSGKGMALGFEDLSLWKGQLKSETKEVKEGNQAGLWMNTVDNNRLKLKNIPHNLQDYNGIQLWINSKVATGSKIAIVLVSENAETSGADYYQKNITIDWTGWKQIRIPFSDFKLKRSPIGFNKIDEIRFASTGYGCGTPSPDTKLILDDIQFVKGTIKSTPKIEKTKIMHNNPNEDWGDD